MSKVESLRKEIMIAQKQLAKTNSFAHKNMANMLFQQIKELENKLNIELAKELHA